MPLSEESKAEPKSYNLGTPINDEKWVESVEFGERFVTINHGEGAELSVTQNLCSFESNFIVFSCT